MLKAFAGMELSVFPAVSVSSVKFTNIYLWAAPSAAAGPKAVCKQYDRS